MSVGENIDILKSVEGKYRPLEVNGGKYRSFGSLWGQIPTFEIMGISGRQIPTFRSQWETNTDL
jgi:hypothetical protein